MSIDIEIDKVIHDLKQTDIDGCITGSCLTDMSKDEWDEVPDIDVFTYSPYGMVHACDVCEYQLGLRPGGDPITSDEGERWKVGKVRTSGRGNRDLATCKFTNGSVVVNVSNRKWERSAMDVIARFDMSIVLQAYDIKSGTLVDFRNCKAKGNVAEIIGVEHGSKYTAIPNPFRSFDGTTWNTAKWLRQWDRVIKYWNRGFDTRPMARFYRSMLNEVIEAGCMFKTEASKAAYEEFVTEFSDLGERIDAWMSDKM